MGVQINQRTSIGNPAFVAGGSTYFDIARLGVLYELMLRVAFTITSGGGAAPSAPLHQTLARIIRAAKIVVNGRDYQVNVSGASLASLAFIDNRGLVARGMDAALPSATSTAYTYEIFLPIRLYQVRGVRPDDTGIDMRQAPAQLVLDWAAADCSDFFGTPASAALSAVTCELSARYHIDPSDKFADGTTRVWKIRQLIERTLDIAASNSKFPVLIDEGTGVFQRGIMLQTLVANAGSDAILANGALNLKVANIVFNNLPARHLKADMQHNFRCTPQAGVYFMDFTLFGQGTTMIPTANLPADLTLEADVTKQSGTNTLIVTLDGFRDTQAFG